MRAKIVSIRFSAEELATVHAQAATRNMSISEYLRSVVLPMTHVHTWELVLMQRRYSDGTETRNYTCSDPKCHAVNVETSPI
jgi:hypothetical protein